MTFADRVIAAALPETKPTRWSGLELYDAEHLVPPEGFLMETLFCRKDISLIAGRRKTGKTYLTLYLAASIAGGTHFGYMPTRKARVLYLSQEMLEDRIRRRYMALLSRPEMAAISENLTIVCREPGIKLDTDSGAKNLESLIQEVGCDVCVVDALGYIKGSTRENDNDEMNEVLLRLLDVASRTNTNIPLVHHMGKPREDGFQSGRGASTIEDRVADIIYITRNRENGKRLVTFEDTRDSEPRDPFTFEIQKDEESGRITLDIQKTEQGLEPLFEIRKMVDLVKMAGGELSYSSIREKMNWASKDTVRKYMKQAEALCLLKSGRSGKEKVAQIPVENDPEVPF